jgi:DHA1 family bicyclomycin/chloramphenicol resistance-like MFS transporter
MLRRRLANLAMLRNAAPIIAPSLGAALLLLAGWRAIPVMLAVSGVLLVGIMAVGFAETLPPERRRSGSLAAELWRTARHLAGARRALGFGAVQGLAGGSLFSYVAGSPLVLIGAFKVSAAVYAGLFAITAWGIVVGAFLAGRLAHRVSAKRLLSVGGSLMLAAPLTAALLMFLRAGWLAGPMACFVAATIGFGLTGPTASHAALEPVPDIAGTAAALLNTFQMLCMCIASVLVAFLFPLAGGLTVPAVMALFAGLGLAIQVGLAHGRPA